MTTPAVIEPSQRYVAVPAWGARSSNRTPEPIRQVLGTSVWRIRSSAGEPRYVRPVRGASEGDSRCGIG